MFIKSIGSIVVLHLNKVQEKLFNFKTKAQKPTFQVRYQQKETTMLSSQKHTKISQFHPRRNKLF